MGIFDRLKNVAKAKVEKAVSKAESADPVAIAKSQLQQAKVDLGEMESAVHSIGADKARIEKEVESLKTDIKRWGTNAETAVDQGNDDLAEKALEKQTELETQMVGLKTSLKSTTGNFDSMKKRLIDQKKKISAADGKISTLEARHKAAEVNLKMREQMSKFEGNGSALDQISLMEEKVAEKENMAAVADSIDDEVNGSDLDAQFAEMEQSSNTSDKLAALKAKRGK